MSSERIVTIPTVDNATNTTPRGPMTVDQLRDMVSNLKPMDTTKLLNPEKLKNSLRLMDMANALYHEGRKYENPQDRHNHLFLKYEPLAHQSYGLYKAAFDGTLYDQNTEIGRFIARYQAAQADPRKIIENVKKYQDEKAGEYVEKINKYLRENPVPPDQSSMSASEQAKINAIIQSYEATKKSANQ